MTDGSAEGDPGNEPQEDRRGLIASIEELRALLAPLTDGDRALVLDLARRLARPAGRP